MLAEEQCLGSLDELRDYVYAMLCQCDELEPGVFQMSEHILMRNGEACGIHFCVHGPRSVKYTAIWETDGNSILFYRPNGERYHKTLLTEAPPLAAAG